MSIYQSWEKNGNCPTASDLEVNRVLPFDASLFAVSFSLRALETIAQELSSRGEVNEMNEAAWAVKALMLTDMTTLDGDDTAASVRRLCGRAAQLFPPSVVDAEFDRELWDQLHVAAVCVYPARIRDAHEILDSLRMRDTVKIAAAAAGFPCGQYGLQSRLQEVKYALLAGATEIDVAISRQLALTGDWEGLYNEVAAMRRACGSRALLKTLLAIGELGSMENIYKTAMACMLAGADFIKTSSGTECGNAPLHAGLVMIYAIQEFRRRTCQLVGLKPAGCVCTVREAVAWMALVRETLGMNWLRPCLFRFGSAQLVDDIERVVLGAIETANRPASIVTEKSVKLEIC